MGVAYLRDDLEFSTDWKILVFLLPCDAERVHAAQGVSPDRRLSDDWQAFSLRAFV